MYRSLVETASLLITAATEDVLSLFRSALIC